MQPTKETDEHRINTNNPERKKNTNSKQNLPTTKKIINWKIQFNQNPLKLSQPKHSTKNLYKQSPPLLKKNLNRFKTKEKSKSKD